MPSFTLFSNGRIAGFLCEGTAPEGVKRISRVVAGDIELAAGVCPEISADPGDCTQDSVVLFATAGHSPLVDALSRRGLVDTTPLAGKRECYMLKTLASPFDDLPGIKHALLIIGSDKRGTIYGMFRLSELCGVSPLVFWGDALPCRKDNITLDFDDVYISKEPSVRYRGFFINDEWPAFGKWCTERYGDVNAKAYDIIFQLLLRLKGNYLWPAMWNSSFSEDGPGIENARLADIYGVVMGASHHEPMNRAGVEWQQQYQKYGSSNEWSFITNSNAITEFWKDGILRNKDFENVITIGMRGESDSLLMGKNATIQDNVNVLKNAITVQNRLIKEHINPNLKEVPRMFAIYKEVEDFYFGIEGDGGLRGWDELEDVILLYSDDNHGNLRAIPQPSDAVHSGGYGIYYHFDYHGGPTSFEWLGHTNLVKAWEQLTMAYEHGIREMWIVNVGDIKGNEYPLSFFMDLAFDYEKWGISNTGSAYEYTERWIDTQFGEAADENQKKQIHELLAAYTTFNTMHIPEALNPGVFKNNFGELGYMRSSIEQTLGKAESLRGRISKSISGAYESMIYYPVTAFLTSMLVNVIAGMNHTHAMRGALVANLYADELRDAIIEDRRNVSEFHAFLGGKWNHMMESAHMCFRTWDDNDWTYPAAQYVSAIPYPKIIVSFRGYDSYTLGFHWQGGAPVCDAQMTRPDCNEIIIDIDSRGDVDFHYNISCDKPWLSFNEPSGKSCLKDSPRTSVHAYCGRSKLCGADTASVRIDFVFDDIDKTQKHALLSVRAGNEEYTRHKGAYLQSQDYVCIPADGFNDSHDTDAGGWRTVPRLGRTGNAIKSFPAVMRYDGMQERPYVCYDFIVFRPGSYILSFYLSPRNPSIKGAALKGCYSVNGGKAEEFDVIPSPETFITNESDPYWSRGVTDNIRKIDVPVSLNDGLNQIKLYASDPNAIYENIVLYPAGKPFLKTHLAPPVSFRIP